MCHSATFTSHFRYTRIFPVQGKMHYWIPSVVPVSKPTPLRVIPTPWASITAPGRTVPFEANSSATHVFLDGFRLAPAITDRKQPLPSGIPAEIN